MNLDPAMDQEMDLFFSNNSNHQNPARGGDGFASWEGSQTTCVALQSLIVQSSKYRQEMCEF